MFRRMETVLSDNASLKTDLEAAQDLYGTETIIAQAQAKCSAEAEITKLVAATQQVMGDADSEVTGKASGWPRTARSA